MTVSFAEQKRLAVEFGDGRKLDFAHVYSSDQGSMYKLEFVNDDSSSLKQEFNTLPTIKEISNFLNKAHLEVTQHDVVAMRLQITA
jgi:hypothetical protein